MRAVQDHIMTLVVLHAVSLPLVGSIQAMTQPRLQTKHNHTQQQTLVGLLIVAAYPQPPTALVVKAVHLAPQLSVRQGSTHPAIHHRRLVFM